LSWPSNASTMRALSVSAAGSERDLAIEVRSARSPSLGAVLLEGPLVQVGQQLGDGPVEVDQVATPIVGVVAG